MARNFVAASTQYLAHTSASPVTAYPFCISARYKPASAGTNRAIIGIGKTGVTERHLLYAGTADGLLAGSGTGGTFGQSVSAASMTAGTWYQVGGAWASATSRKAVLNGTIATADTTNVSISGMDRIYTAAYYNNGLIAGFYGAGDICEVGVWDVDLAADEWTALGGGLSPLMVRPQNLVAYWPLLARATDEEDWTDAARLLTNTNSATAADHPRVIMPAWPKRVQSVSAVAGGPVGTATETDAALALSGLQILATGQADETDAALALAGVSITAAGRSDETDSALALTPLQITATGRADETDTALALSSGTQGPVGLAEETDAALALAAVQITATGRADETDTALALNPGTSAPVGMASESDTAFALAAVQSLLAGMAEETDSALTLGGAEEPRRSQGAGRPGKPGKRRRVVEIDGQDFVVNSEAEAAALLDHAREQARQLANTAVRRAAAAERRPVRKVIADARRLLETPDIKAPEDLQPLVQQAQDDITAIYASALASVEIAAHLARRQREEEDDEDVLLLIA